MRSLLRNPAPACSIQSEAGQRLALESWEFLGTEKQVVWRGYACHLERHASLLFDLGTDASEVWDMGSRSPEGPESGL